MTWTPGNVYQTRSGADAHVEWAVGAWVGGFVLQGNNPLSMRWNANNGQSSEGQQYNLLPVGGKAWVAVYYLRGGKVSASSHGTEAEAEKAATRGNNERIAVLEVTL